MTALTDQPRSTADLAADRINRGQVDAGMHDLLRASHLAVSVGGDDTDVHTLRLDGAPWSKSRPRHTRSGVTYTKPEDRVAEKRTADLLRAAFAEPLPGSVALACIFYRPNRQRIDADNMLKHICDAANGILWHDDSQVTAIVGIIELDPGHPRTVIAVSHHLTTMGRRADWTKECPACGQHFVVDPSYPARRYCTNECGRKARGHVLGDPVPCASCGEPFKRITSSQKYCKPECRADALRGRPKNRERNQSRCSTCGKGLAHQRGGQCRDCWKADGFPRPAMPRAPKVVTGPVQP
jgi:Holliday junction resolvase RusA-like endonuclease